MNSRKKFRQNKNKTRNKRGGGPQEDAELFHAVDTGQSVSQINLILDKGVDVNISNSEGDTPLHYACIKGHKEVAMALVDRGADVHARDVVQLTPLHFACINGNMELAMALVDRGADVHARDGAQRTSLHWACIEGHKEVAMALVDRGADVDAKDKRNETALEVAKETINKEDLRNAAAKYKKNKDALFAAVEKAGTTAAEINAILDKGAYVNARNDKQQTPLHWACINDNMELAMALMDRGADVNARDKHQITPLHHACGNDNMELAMALVNKGADVDAKNYKGNTPLHRLYSIHDLVDLNNAAVKYKENKDKLLETEKKETPIRRFVTTKNNWKIYLNDEDVEEFENLNGKYEVEFSHGSIYQGDWKDNKKHGKGKFISNNGTKTLVYEGEWEHGNIHGKGKMKYHNNSVYEGEWKHGKIHGKGKYTYADGDVYEGDFVEGKMHGKGIYKWDNGNVYEGDYVEDKRHGKGTYTFANGNVYEGDFVKGKRHGKGTHTFADGGVYEGDFQDNVYHGKGKYNLPNGDVYEGDFKNDKFNGKGIFKHKHLNSVHEGEFKDGLATGIGKYTDANGVYEGEFHEDNMIGIFKVTYKNKPTITVEYDYNYVENAEGELYNFELQDTDGPMDETKFDYFKGEIKDGKATGKAVFTPPYSYVNNEARHLKYIGNIVNNKKEGQGILKYKNKKSNKVIYKDDKLIQGEQGEYYHITVGDIYFEILEGKIENGLASGKVYITDDGEILEYNGYIVNNKKHGKGYCYYNNNSEYDGDWENDKRHGNGKGTYESAIYEGQWVENKREGQGKMTYTKGEEKGSFYEGEWKNDKWHGKGKVIFSNETYDGDWIENKRTGKGRLTYTTGAKKGSFYEGEWKNDRKNGYGVNKYENAVGCCPAGSTYEGYWKNDIMETQGNEVSKLTWPAHDSSYPDKSTPCGLRSFEGKWKNNMPETPRAGYEDIPIAIENWGNYIWYSYDGRVLLDQAAANAYEIHQKGRKMKQKLGPVIEYIKQFDDASNETEELIQIGSPRGACNYILSAFNSVGDGLSQQQTVDLQTILIKLERSDYIRDRNSKEIILNCVSYITNTNNHDLNFSKYYISTFIEENIHAYDGPNGLSCTDGIFERFFTVFAQTINLALHSEGYVGDDTENKERRTAQYNEILNLWGLKKPDMGGILTKFDSQDNDALLEGKSQPEKVRALIEFIKEEYRQAEQNTSTVENDLDEFLMNNYNINRDSLFDNPFNTTFGGKRKNRRKTRRRIQKKTKRRIQKKKAKRTHKKKSKNTKSRR